VHVASGLLKSEDNKKYPMVKAHFRTHDRLAIPATSLKGCIRSILEAISPSAVAVSRAHLDRKEMASRSADKLDVAQRLFGAMGYQGQVRFSDALLEGNTTEIVPTPPLYRPRPEAVDTYFDGKQVKGRKFYMHGQLAEGDLPLETCPVDSRFSFTMDFENVTQAELGLLLIALGLGEPRLWPKLGGAKPACLGTLEVQEQRLEVWDSRNRYLDEELSDTAEDWKDLKSLFEAAHSEKLVLDAQLKRLAEVLRWPREDRACPDRSY
jgi:CRISPR/Cas system CSM-associated protein Csm3 (group 7 of RAMP superfamily)